MDASMYRNKCISCLLDWSWKSSTFCTSTFMILDNPSMQYITLLMGYHQHVLFLCEIAIFEHEGEIWVDFSSIKMYISFKSFTRSPFCALTVHTCCIEKKVWKIDFKFVNKSKFYSDHLFHDVMWRYYICTWKLHNSMKAKYFNSFGIHFGLWNQIKPTNLIQK